MEASRIKQELVRRTGVCNTKILRLENPSIHDVGGFQPRRVLTKDAKARLVLRLEGERDAYKDLLLMFGENPVRKIGKHQYRCLVNLRRNKQWPMLSDRTVAYTKNVRVHDTLVLRGFALRDDDGIYTLTPKGKEALERAELRAS